MPAHSDRRLKLTLLVIDSAAIAAAMVVAYLVRTGGWVGSYHSPANVESYLVAAGIVLPLWVVIHAVAGLYDMDVIASGIPEYVQVLKASAFGVIGTAFLTFWDRSLALSRGWALLLWVLAIALVVSGRYVSRCVLMRWRARGKFCSRALVVGTNERAIAIAAKLNSNVSAGMRVVGFLDESLPHGREVIPSVPVVGNPAELRIAVRNMCIQELVIIPEALAWESFQEVICSTAELPQEVRTRLCPGLYEILATGMTLTEKADVPLLTLTGLRIHGLNAASKLAMDYLLGFILALATAPLLVLVSVLLLLSRGVVIDRYLVLGRRGRVFRAMKFHTGLLGHNRRTFSTRAVGSPASGCSAIGRVLYRTGLDKLPQILNVLMGQMSLVGPRTINQDDERHLSGGLRGLLSVRPGMTGPWALSDPVTLNEEMEDTFLYIKNWSLSRDIRVLLQTSIRVLGARGKVSPGYRISKISSSGTESGEPAGQYAVRWGR